eukprot:ANDGO_02351.mRNA.1 Cytokinin riboside 5'-monophosphate phosphoribohydrolase LOG2
MDVVRDMGIAERMISICVFCGSSSGNDPVFATKATELGQLFASHNIRLVYGGGGIGIMGAVARGAADSGAAVLGVIPESLAPREVSGTSPPGEVVVVKTMHERKQLMASNADAFIALPGGIGTLEELFEMATWTQLGIHRKVIGVLNVNGFYEPLRTLITQLVETGFLGKKYADNFIYESDPELLLKKVLQAQAPDGVVQWKHTVSGEEKLSLT